MKVLVTGAAGFIGGQLMHALWKNGHTAIGVDNYSYGSADNLHFDDHDFSADVIKMDIRDKEGMKALFEQEKFDIVYNIAGIAPCRTARATRWRPSASTRWALSTCWKTPAAPALSMSFRHPPTRCTRMKPSSRPWNQVQPAHADLSQHQILRRAVLPELCRYLRHEHHLPALCQRLRPAH